MNELPSLNMMSVDTQDKGAAPMNELPSLNMMSVDTHHLQRVFVQVLLGSQSQQSLGPSIAHTSAPHTVARY